MTEHMLAESAHTTLDSALQALTESTGTEAVDVVEHGSIVVGLDVVSIVIAAVIGYIGVLIMTYGCFVSLWQFIRSTWHGGRHLPMIRVHLGKHLALGLEFLVGKDIVESIVSPSWDDLGKLGAIIILRTIVTIFLSRELKEVEQELNLEERELRLEKKMHRGQAHE